MVGQLRPLFQTTGHKVKTQGITQSSGLKRGDLEIINYLTDAAGMRNLVIDVSVTHDRIGSSKSNPQLNGTLSHPNAPDALLNQAIIQRSGQPLVNSPLNLGRGCLCAPLRGA